MPAILVSNEDGWTNAYVAAVARGDERKHEKWRHREIKAALREEVDAKCAYCEQYVENVSYPHVEHIVPKKIKPDLAHRWYNLTSACGRCNIEKDVFYDPDQGLLNPYVDTPDGHLRFLGGIVDWHLGNGRGEITVRRLKLNRLDLVHARVRRLAEIRDVVDRWHAATDPLKDVLADGIRLDARVGEFTQSVCAYLVELNFPL